MKNIWGIFQNILCPDWNSLDLCAELSQQTPELFAVYKIFCYSYLSAITATVGKFNNQTQNCIGPESSTCCTRKNANDKKTHFRNGTSHSRSYKTNKQTGRLTDIHESENAHAATSAQIRLWLWHCLFTNVSKCWLLLPVFVLLVCIQRDDLFIWPMTISYNKMNDATVCSSF